MTIQHFAMPRLLVSVRDSDEADAVCRAGADLVDAKDPENGALGALSVETVRAIVARIGTTVRTSAVAGEPATPEDMRAQVATMARTGVDFVKVAVSRSDSTADLSAAAGAAPGRLIGVFFAEDDPGPDLVIGMARVGFCGAMIDTRGKHGRRLTDLMQRDRLAAFVEACRAHGILSGLAGSLRIGDIPRLAELRPSYLGFRGGLCLGGDRRNPIDPLLVAEAAETLRACACRDAA